MSAALRRAAASKTLLALALLFFSVGTVGGTYAVFSAETQHQSSTFAGGWVAAPTGLQPPTVSGYGASLSWTHATHGVTNEDLYGTDEGTTSSCSGAAYSTAFATGLGATTDSTTDSRGSSANGHWICYQIRSTHGSWYTGANFSIVRVGLVPTTLATAEGSNPGNNAALDQGDTITITYNQAVSYSGGAILVCTFTDGTILLGDATTGNASCGSSGDTATIGKITNLSIGNARTYTSSSVGVGGSTVTVTLGNGGSGSSGRTSASGTGTFTGSGSPTSTSGGAVACTITGCTPTAGFSY
jgi:hypothetical protein